MERRGGIYLDHNATTVVRPEVLACVGEVSRDVLGNPSSFHRWGRRSRALLEDSRERFAALLGVRPRGVIFTSGGTEANRLAIEGALASARTPGARGSECPHAVVSAIEHASVRDVYRFLEDRGAVRVTWVRAAEDGCVSPEGIAAALERSTRLVSLQHANNETGVLQDVTSLAGECRRRNVLAHTDAVQSLGKVPLDLGAIGADLVTVSSHKIGGPQGAGALLVGDGSAWTRPWTGGPQERGRRPGTENLPAIAGFVRAVELARNDVDSSGGCLGARLWTGLERQVSDVWLNGDPSRMLPNTRNVSFRGVEAEDLLIRLDLEGVAASAGSACASGSRDPSHVLEAMGLPEWRVRSAVRFSTGWSTSPEEVDTAVRTIARVVRELRNVSGGVTSSRARGA